jgi:hypothetical protein
MAFAVLIKQRVAHSTLHRQHPGTCRLLLLPWRLQRLLPACSLGK